MNLVSIGHVKKGNARGFTLIELLVVIAIIGILSAVVLASLSTARSKGKDAKIQEELSSTRAQAEIFYSGNGNSYDNGTTAVCTTAQTANGIDTLLATVLADAGSGVTRVHDAVGATTKVDCNDTSSGWAAEAPLSTSGQMWCADSTGFSGPEGASTLTTTSDVTCG